MRSRRLRPAVLINFLFATNGLVFGSMVGTTWPWWLALSMGLVNLVLLVLLRMSLHDYLLAQFVGVDVIIRDKREPRILVVVPDPVSKVTQGPSAELVN